MKILITGAAGFIGSTLADRFRLDGHGVFGVDNLETGRLGNWPRVHELDIVQRQAFYEYANQIAPELIIHCAASYKNPDRWHQDIETNVAGMVNVVNAARHHEAKVVYFQTALPPVSSYAISKIAAQQYLEISDVPSLIFRLANIYGPRNLSGPIPAFFKRLSAGERCTVTATVRDMVYVDDLVECVIRALAGEATGTYSVCSGTAVPILALYRAVASFFENPPEPDLIQPPVDDVPTEVAMWKGLPGWVSETPLSVGVPNAVNWYRQNGVTEAYTHLKLEEVEMDPARELLRLLREAVGDALTDETGAVLSGGIDSSTIVCLAEGLPTFTGFYQGKAYDERPYARLVASATEHHEIEITPEDFVEHFDDMLRAAQPPYQGMGTFGQYMVAKHASLYVDRVLSGEGGDGSFGGYCRLLMVAGEARPDGYEDYVLPDGYPSTLVDALAWDWERLPDLLAVDDQMTGAFDLEAVAPFTDERVVEFVLGLSPELRVGKKLLKQAVKGIVPDAILERTDKRGFPAPLVEWAQREPVRSFVKERLGYIPAVEKPWDRGWWLELCERSQGSLAVAI